MREAWTEIARRSAEAKGGDRVLDADVFELGGGRAWDEAYNRAQEPCGCPHDQAVAIARDRYSPRFTASLDAVVALIEERLPEWSYEFSSTVDGDLAWVWKPYAEQSHETRHVAIASNAPLALLLAFALAMAEQTGAAGVEVVEAGGET